MRLFNNIRTAALAALLVATTSCNDWLTEPTPGSTELKDFYTSGTTCKQSIIAAYHPLMWEYGGTYFSEWCHWCRNP